MIPQDNRVPRIICHRGASGYAPENTLAAMRKAAELGGRWVEFDAKLTRDNHVVLLHDDDLDRTTSGRGKVAQTDWDTVRRLDAGRWFGEAFRGEPVPTLSETIVELARLGLGANVEIKPCPGREEETGHMVAALLLEEWPDSLPAPLLSSFSAVSLAAARRVAPILPRAYLVSRVRADWRDRVRELDCVAIHTNHRNLTADRVAEVKAAGLAIRAYTVNDRALGESLFAWGVDGVFTDFADRLLAI
ncbi:MAG: glycerophosphodiester phosphodiesterase [Rhodospirillales bacterium]|jgi:glycerophosphoryl diester phosphodiesterase|nr:glycerophosphodiester phosphodiesterase [Rhodospirillales bacterium]